MALATSLGQCCQALRKPRAWSALWSQGPPGDQSGNKSGTARTLHTSTPSNMGGRQWFASDFAIGIELRIKQHPRVFTTCGGPSDDDRSRPRNRPCGPTRQALPDAVAEERDLLAAG